MSDTTIDNEAGRRHYTLGVASAVNNMTLGDDIPEAARIPARNRQSRTCVVKNLIELSCGCGIMR
jgi:hypothetical protein